MPHTGIVGLQISRIIEEVVDLGAIAPKPNAEAVS
jgi:hypothetical protein